MAKEIEMKILDIDVGEAKSRLRRLGARFVGRYTYRRVAFRISEGKRSSSWIRVRTDGKKSWITFKRYRGRKLSAAEEYEVEVKDFKATAMILTNLFDRPIYGESSRIEYIFNGCMVTLDKWARIPLFMEIEGPNEKTVMDTYAKLGISGRRVGNIPSPKVYEMYGIDFDEVAKRDVDKLRRLIGR